MRIFTLITTLFFFSISCKTTYIQLYKADSKNLINTGETFMWENDTVAIQYSFWANRGIMAFSIYNKLDNPIYVDWKKSTCILNSYKFNYWSDDIETNSTSFSKTKSSSVSGAISHLHYNYIGPLIQPFSSAYGVSKSVSTTKSIGTSITSRQERITFVPPKSYFYSSRHYLTDDYFKD